MAEVYAGTKFRTVFTRRAVSGDERLGELLKWCRRWAALGLVGDTVGNLSFRTVDGFLINRTAGDLGGITRQEFVEVVQVDGDKRELTVVGLYEPSSESLMHAGIYEARPGKTRQQIEEYGRSTPYGHELALGKLSKKQFFHTVAKDLAFDGPYEEF